MMRFIEHSEAGRILAQRLLNLGIERPVVLAVPPGGPRVGKEIAARLDAPLDVLLIRSISIPGRSACPVGVVVDGAFYPDERACRREAVTLEYARILAWPEQGAEERWEREVRHNRHPIDIEGRTAIVVNDALLDREQLLAIRESLRERGVGRILHVAVLARGEEETGTLPVPTITLFSPVESRSVMLVNAGYQQTTEREIAELLTLTAGT
jgi:putative phosphoribosyl transferase